MITWRRSEGLLLLPAGFGLSLNSNARKRIVNVMKSHKQKQKIVRSLRIEQTLLYLLRKIRELNYKDLFPMLGFSISVPLEVAVNL